MTATPRAAALTGQPNRQCDGGIRPLMVLTGSSLSYPSVSSSLLRLQDGADSWGELIEDLVYVGRREMVRDGRRGRRGYLADVVEGDVGLTQKSDGVFLGIVLFGDGGGIPARVEHAPNKVG